MMKIKSNPSANTVNARFAAKKESLDFHSNKEMTPPAQAARTRLKAEINRLPATSVKSTEKGRKPPVEPLPDYDSDSSEVVVSSIDTTAASRASSSTVVSSINDSELDRIYAAITAPRARQIPTSATTQRMKLPAKSRVEIRKDRDIEIEARRSRDGKRQ